MTALSVARMRLPTARRPAAFPALLLAGLLAGAMALAGCSSEDPRTAPTPEPSPTAIADLNTAGMQVPRIDFCKLVPAEAVTDALAGKPTDAAAYGNGDVEPLSGVAEQVLHEIGCVWQGDGDVTARAWLFARPVEPGFARRVVADARRTKGCRVVEGPGFGQPSYSQACTRVSGEQRVRHAGLFGQSWLSCEIAAPAGDPVADLRSRTDAWCVEVANALNTSR